LGQNISEKNFAKIKMSKQLAAWTKETWIIPELKYNSDLSVTEKVILKLEKNKINNLKKKIGGVNLPEKSKNQNYLIIK
jgi:hypothetical protein